MHPEHHPDRRKARSAALHKRYGQLEGVVYTDAADYPHPRAMAMVATDGHEPRRTEEDRLIEAAAVADPLMSAREIWDVLDLSLSCETIRRRLKEAGLKNSEELRGVSGLGQNRRYLLALDFCQIASEVDLRFLEFTEPYYMPRPNHLKGRQWMGSALYFNLTSIANGGLQESAMTLRVDCEYEPTLRLLELRDDHLPSGSSAIRFTLKGSEFLVVSLTSE
ncbi:hypothetical protein HPB47_013065, partial [Ixodes persulcatus]